MKCYDGGNECGTDYSMSMDQVFIAKKLDKPAALTYVTSQSILIIYYLTVTSVKGV